MVHATRGNPEESEEGHAECSEVGVFSQALAGIILLTAETPEHLHPQGGEDEEQQEEEEAEIPHLKQRGYPRVGGTLADLW